MRHHKKTGQHLSRHHLIPRIRGGTNSKKNLLLLWRDKHNLWHNIFSVSTLDEIIFLLKKGRYANLVCKNFYWRIMWKEKTPEDVRQVMLRIKRFKNRRIKTKRKKPRSLWLRLCFWPVFPCRLPPDAHRIAPTALWPIPRRSTLCLVQMQCHSCIAL